MDVATKSLRIALVGVPNCGKTALFNRLTGSRQKVANYPGVTVERREGERATADGRTLRVLDLPGTYSLAPTTLDEAITRDVLLGRIADAPAPDLVVCVIDAVHLPIGLRLALEVKRLGLPMVIALNRMDVAKRRGVTIDVTRLAKELGVAVLPTIAVQRGGADALITTLEAHRPHQPPVKAVWSEPTAEDAEQTHADVRGLLTAVGYAEPKASAWFARLDSLLLHDPYLVLADFGSYLECQRVVARAYADRDRWTRLSILNVARSGKFSSDRAVREDLDDIWRASPVPVRLISQDDIAGNLLQ